MKKEFQKEIADVFSWLCAIVIKLNNLIDDSNKILIEFGYVSSSKIEISFVEIIGKYYFIEKKWRCRTCGEVPCNIEKHETKYQIKRA